MGAVRAFGGVPAGELLADVGLSEPAYRLVLVDGRYAPELSNPRWSGPRYRVCTLTGREALRATIGGLNIPYAAIPINKRTGITIGGTRYFMV
jgi:hypothetical protein